MGLLSNLLGFRDGRADDDGGPVRVRPAVEAEFEAALQLILSPPGASADARAAQEFLGFARERGIAFDGLHVAERGGRVLWAALPVVSPGRTMLILCPPGGVGKAPDGVGREVIEAVCGAFAANGIQLAQSLIDPHDGVLEGVFAEAGFTRMAELYYLHAQPPAEDSMPALPPGMEWVTYDESREESFGRAVLASYQDSLDCPALNGRREVGDVLAGHRATGTFDPSIWFLLQEGGESLGVLLLSESLRADAVELVYVGLAPAARGRRLGELMMRQALAVTARRRQPRLCLAVDAENVPALKLYYRHGMRRVGSKLALMKDLRGGG